MKKTITISGMNCGHCAAAVEAALAAVPGVSAASVDLAAKQASVDAAPDVSEAALREAVEEAGYTVEAVS